jgi:hypothetical protein
MAERAGARPPTPLLFGRHMRAALNSDPRRARRIRRYIGQLRPAKCVADAPCCSPHPAHPVHHHYHPTYRLYRPAHGPPSDTPANDSRPAGAAAARRQCR